MELSWTTATTALVTVFTISKVFKFVSGLKAVDHLPGLRVPFQPLSLLGIIVPERSWNPGVIFVWTWRHTRNIYHRFGNDTVSVVPFFSGAPTVYTQSMEVARQVVTAGHKTGVFGKTDDMSRVLLFWGPSVTVAEQDQWRKHRRIVGPAFNNDTYKLVWDTTQRMYADMIDCERWAEKATIDVPRLQQLTFKFTLIIIATCGFGLPFSWADPPSHDGQMSIQQCLEIITVSNVFAIAAPKWAWKLPLPWVRHTRQAFDTMRAFMNSHVQARREAMHSSAGDDTAKDILSLLVQASEGEGGKMSLDDNELIGNTFALLFAGHETTAHTLAATLGFLSLNLSIQEEIVEQIREVTKGRENGEITFDDYGKLDKVLAAFYEGIRMFPSGLYLIREAKEDTVLNLSGVGEEPKMLPVKKGTHVIVDMVGVHYNPRYFSDPEEFEPARWYDRTSKEGISDVEDHTAFSVGPRTCLGKKFSTTEAVCLLTLLLRDWRVEPLLSVNASTGVKETTEEWRTRVMQATMNITMGVRDVPLTFSKRV